MKNFKIIALVLAMGLIFAGCSMVEVNEERDAQTVIAEVGEEVVLKGDFQAMYDMYVMYGQFPEDMDTNPEYAEYYEYYAEAFVEQLVNEKVKVVKAKELNLYDLTDEESAEVLESVNNELDTYISIYQSELSMSDEYADKSEEEMLQIATDNINDYLSVYGTTKEDITSGYTEQVVMEKLFDVITADVTVTEDEVKADYDSKLEAQKSGYEDGTVSYEALVSGSSDEIYYIPEGVRQAQHILISISDEASAEISQLETNGDTEAAETAREEALAEIKADADAAYNRAVAGEDFKALIEELGQDPGMESNEYYSVIENSTQFVPEFAEGLFSLNAVGDISEPVATNYGYHIIKYYGDEPSGEVNYDDVRDGLYENMLSEKQNMLFEEELNKWKELIDINVKMNKILD